MKKMEVRENKMREKKIRENKTHAKISWTKVYYPMECEETFVISAIFWKQKFV